MVCPRSETPSLDRLELGQGKFLKNKKINNFFQRYSNPGVNFRHQVVRLRTHSVGCRAGIGGSQHTNKWVPHKSPLQARMVHRLWGSVHDLHELQRTKTLASPGTAESALGSLAKQVSRGQRDVICFLPCPLPWGPSRHGAHQPSSPLQDSQCLKN